MLDRPVPPPDVVPPMPTSPLHPSVLAGALVSLLTASTAAAQLAVDPARYSVVLLGDGSSAQYTVPGDYRVDGATGNARMSVQTAPFTMLTAHATSTTFDACYCYGGGAAMTYFFRILGAPGTRVSGTFTADMFATLALPALDEVSGA